MQRTDSFEKTLMWERLKAGGEGDKRGWDGWMTSPTQWTRVWVNCGSWQWTGRPGVLQSVGSQIVGQIEQLNWTEPAMWWYCNQLRLYVAFPRQNPPPPYPAPASCLWKNFNLLGILQVAKNKFKQRNEKFQKQKETLKQDKIITV